MTDTLSPSRVEPNLDADAHRPEPSSLVDDPRTPDETFAPVSSWDSQSPYETGDRLARIEDKAARIEEKYARSEAFLQRIGDKVETATARMNDVALQADLRAVRGEVNAIARRVRGLAGLNALVATSLVTAILTSAITVAVLKFGIPGVLPR